MNQVLKKFNLEQERYILMVSRLVRHKGVHYLIEAFKNLSHTLFPNPYTLVIVGDGAFTDDYVKELEKLAGDNKNIIFTGPLHGENLKALFKGAYLFVLPSEAEGLSTTILEAMTYRVPVLASDIPENMELVKNHGWHFKNKDVNDLKNKIEYLIKHPEVLKVRVEKAKKFVLVNYNWPDLAHQTEKLYAGVLVKEEMVRWVKNRVTCNA